MYRMVCGIWDWGIGTRVREDKFGLLANNAEEREREDGNLYSGVAGRQGETQKEEAEWSRVFGRVLYNIQHRIIYYFPTSITFLFAFFFCLFDILVNACYT